MIETNIDEAAEQVEWRELWSIATMIKRRQDEEGQGPEPTTYLGLALSAPEVGGRFGSKPVVVGSEPVPAALPASGPWAGDPCGIEPPLGFSIDELPALGGASEPLHSAGVEVSAPQVSGGAGEHDSGEQR
jgi:hypothetical protein